MQDYLHCAICHHAFTVKDVRRPHHTQWTPVLLNCGHTFCELCMSKLSKSNKLTVECPDCKSVTPLLEEGSTKCLLPDVYTHGLIAVSKQNDKVLAANSMNPLQFVPAGIVKLMKRPSQNHVQPANNSSVVCCECNKNPGTCRCLKCDCIMCAMCFDKVHKSSRTLRKHQAVPINDEYSKEVCPTNCATHDSRIIEYYCEDCLLAICSHCVIVGVHKGHNISSMEEKNKVAISEIQETLPGTVAVLKNLQKAEKELSTAVPDNKLETSHVIDEVQRHFHRLHTALQLREVALISEIENKMAEHSSDIQNLKVQVVEEIKRIEFLLKDAQKVANNQLILNANYILDKLHALPATPCVLVPNDHQEGQFRCDLDQSLLEVIKSHGAVECNVEPRYVLKTLTEAPSHLVEEDDGSSVLSGLQDDDETSSQCSAVSDSNSSISIGPPAPPVDRVVPTKPLVLKKQKFHFVKQERVYVTHIKDPSYFMVQKCADGEKIKQLSASINKWCNSAEANNFKLTDVETDSIVLAQYSMDNTWYRARVKRVLSGDTAAVPGAPGPTCVELFYVDYGNTEVVPVERLRKMQGKFLRQPELVTQCCLFDIVPPEKKTNWPLESITAFARMTSEKSMIMTVIRQVNSVFHVDLSKPANSDVNDDRPVSVRDALVFLELGYFTSAASKTYRNPSQHFPLRDFLKPVLPEVGQDIQVFVSHVVSPDLFFVQLIGEETEYLSELMAKMQETYSHDSGDLWTVFCPQKGMICAAQFDDNQWYRARVEQMPGRKQIEIQYVDYGNNQLISHWRLRKILDVFTVLPTQAVQCQLVDVASPSSVWSSECVSFFNQTVSSKKLYARVVDVDNDCLSVVLYDTSTSRDLCINGLMVSEGHAISTGDRSLVTQMDLHLPRIVESSQSVYEDQDEYIGDVVQVLSPSHANCIPTPSATPRSEVVSEDPAHLQVAVTVTQATSPTDFYLQLVSAGEEGLDRLMEDLQLAYSGESVTCVDVSDLTVGDFCAVEYSEDKRWYRGLVKEVDSGTAKVLLCDYGYLQQVELAKLQPLLDQFHMPSSFAIHCHLAGITAAGSSVNKWSCTACELFSETIDGQKIFLVRKGDIDGDSLPCELMIERLCLGTALELATVELVCVSKLLVEAGLALPVRSRPSSNCSTPRPTPSASLTSLPVPSSPSTKTPSSEACVSGQRFAAEHSGTSITAVNADEYEAIPAPQSSVTFTMCTSPIATTHSHMAEAGCSTSPLSPDLDSAIVGDQQMVPALNKNNSNNASGIYDDWLLEDPLRPEMISFPSYERPCQASFPIVATYVSRDCVIYLQEYKENHPLLGIMEKLQVMYRRSGAQDETLYRQKGMACVAQYSEDGLWYRATVLSVHDELGAEVQFVDYGNSEFVSFSCLRCLPCDSELIGIPQQCYPCILYGVRPSGTDGSWTASVIDCLTKLLLSQASVVEIKDILPDCLSVSITLSDNRTVTEVLTYLGAVEAVDSYILRSYKPPVVQKRDKPFRALVTHVETPNKLFVQYCKCETSKDPLIQAATQQVIEMDRLQVSLMNEADTLPMVSQFFSGQACCALYAFDNSWHRAEIAVVCPNPDIVLVVYVDYGTTEYIAISSGRIREIPEQYTRLPAQAMEFHIRHLVPVGEQWTNEATDIMLDILNDKVVTIIVKNDSAPYSIALYEPADCNPTLLVPAYQPLVDCGLAKVVTSVPSVKKESKRATPTKPKAPPVVEIQHRVREDTDDTRELEPVEAFDSEGHLLVAGQTSKVEWSEIAPGSDPASPVKSLTPLSFKTAAED